MNKSRFQQHQSTDQENLNYVLPLPLLQAGDTFYSSIKRIISFIVFKLWRQNYTFNIKTLNQNITFESLTINNLKIFYKLQNHKKTMNLNPQEQILIKDIFNVTVDHTNPGGAYLLSDFSKEIHNLGQNVSLIQHNTYFDSLLMQRLQVPGTQIIAYLQQCLNRCHYVIQKPWNQNQRAQNFIKYSIEIIKNFIFLVLQEPQIFSDQLEIDQKAAQCNDKKINIAMRLMSHFERRGYNPELLNIIYPKIQTQINGNFAQAFLEVLIARQRFLTILDSKAFFYLTLLLDLMMIPQFKIQFFKLSSLSFIPKPKGNQPINGAMIQTNSPFGLFARISILGFNASGYYFQQQQIVNKFEERMRSEFGHDKIVKTQLKHYQDLQNEFYSKFTQVYKALLKKQTQKQFLQWNYALIQTNLKKGKLASRLQGSNNAQLSHDGIVLNAYMVFLNLCKPFLAKQGQKYKSIDPQYYMFKRRALNCKYEPINQKNNKTQKIQIQKQYGTITEFFFLCLQLLNIGLVSVQDNFVQLNQYKQKLQKQKPNILKNHKNDPMMLKKFQYMIETTQSKMIRCYIVLMDDRLITGTIKLLDMLMFLLPKWIGIDYNNLKHGKIQLYKVQQLATYIPAHFLENIYKFHLNNFKFKANYLNLVGQDHIHQLLKLTCLLLSQQQISTNPYMAGNFVQLIFYFLHQTKTNIMYQIFKQNQIAHTNFTNGLIRFYCDIAVTGSSHQFYSKFKYRFYVNKLFTSLWAHQVYRQNLKEYFHLPVFEKFLNMVMTDTTYCFDQTNQSYKKYKDLQDKKQNGQLSEEDRKNQQQLTTIISSTLQQSTSNLRLMRQLSAWSPQTFLEGAQISTVVPLLNNILKTFVDPTTFVMNRQLLGKHKFQKQIVLSDLLQIFVNLDINEKLSNEIVRDGRSYKKQYFSKALQKASNQHYTGVQTLQRFQILIGKLSTAVNEQQDQQVYGQIPQKYLCALMSTLMKYPVLLPTSGNIVDKVNIQRSLLIDERDPFTRAPLKFAQVKQDKALKEQIQNWKKKRMQQIKKGGKQIKYGNIQNNKKQKDQEQKVKESFLDIEDEDNQI